MRLARPLAVAVLLAAPGWAAAEWTTIASTEALVIEMDPDLVRMQGDFAMAYTRATFTVPQPVEGRPDVTQQSQMQLHAIDCAAGASTIVGVMVYPGTYGRGELIDQTTRPRAEWSPRPAPPGSLAERTVRLACAELSRRGTK
jgi:D-serine deaminase-like pyridoxal phosphate-dependent protein